MVNDPKTLGLYCHIPFCKSKCAYCDFCSVAGSGNHARSVYVDALCREIAEMGKRAEGYAVDSVFIGGGTPTLLGDSLFKKLISCMYDEFFVADSAEFTVEANPATVTKKLAETLVRCGVNRVSLGLQSVHQNELKLLGRIHTLEDFEKSYEILRMAGITNINVDVMFGIPEQTAESFLNTLKHVVSLHPEHISAYGLQIEPGTPFFARKDELPLPSEDEEYSMYIYACEFLEQHGYGHYEISNFALPGKECRHNKKYWNGDQYIGLGCAAHSFFGGERFGRCEDISQYVSSVKHKALDSTVDSREVITLSSFESDYVMLRMRLAEGVNKKAYKTVFGFDFDERYADKLKPYVDAGFVINGPDACRFTTDGMYVSNTVLSSILDI